MEFLNDIFFTNATKYLNIIMIISAIILLITIIELWIIFKKMGEKGYKSIIPFYNSWIYMKFGNLPGWLSFIPVANIIGFLVVAFTLPKKMGKSSALGILFLIAPNIYYLILILSKTKEINNLETNNSSNIDKNSSLENSIIKEEPKKEPEFVEQPALNTEEVIKPETTVSNNAYINIEKEKPIKHVDEDIINAFDIPLPETTEDKTESLEMIDTLTKLKQSDIQDDLTKQNNTNQDIEVFDQTVTPIDKDILEETVELPKMVNEEINSGLKATKHCFNCGFENEYSQKNCLMCGEPLI